MAEQVKIQKTIYSTATFNKVVDTDFTQLANSKRATTPPEKTVTVNKFFNEYDELFYQIPPSGSEESHLALATRSLDYLGLSLDVLQSEITYLREENIDLKNQIVLSSQINLGTEI